MTEEINNTRTLSIEAIALCGQADVEHYKKRALILQDDLLNHFKALNELKEENKKLVLDVERLTEALNNKG